MDDGDGRSGTDASPDPEGASAGEAPERWGPQGERTPLGWARWALTTDHGPVAYARELLFSVTAVLLVGMLLFAVSGVWPPMVAIESGSMKPNIQKGDLVFVMEEKRFAGPGPTVVDGESTGVVTARAAERNGAPYTKFGRPGDVIVYKPDGRERSTPIIHRAQFWVNRSENWYGKADPDAVGAANNCRQLRNCPAPNAGFITKGDNEGTNRKYDQLTGISRPVRPSWVVGTAEFRIPFLGYIRLGVGSVVPDAGLTAAGALAVASRGRRHRTGTRRETTRSVAGSSAPARAWESAATNYRRRTAGAATNRRRSGPGRTARRPRRRPVGSR